MNYELLQYTSNINCSNEPLIISTTNLKVQCHLSKLLLRIPPNEYTTINILLVI